MAISTYDELVAEVALWLHRGDLTARIPNFLALAEGELRLHPAVYKLVTEEFSTTSGEAVYDLGNSLPTAPGAANIDSVRSISLVGSQGLRIGGPLSVVAADEIDRAGMLSDDYTGSPLKVAYLSKELVQIYPTPDDEYTLRVAYKQRLPALTALSPSNWLLTEHPQIYLYATLLQAEPFLINDERVALWAQKVSDGLGALSALREREEFPTQLVRRPRNSIGRTW